MTGPETPVERRDDGEAPAHVGEPVTRTDAPAKVTGRAVFTTDVDPGRTLHAALVTSQVPHARLTGVDTSAAEAVSGVRAVLTAADVPDTRRGKVIRDQPILAGEKVRYMGEPIAVVAAETEDLAAKGARRVDVGYDRLDAVFDLEAAFRRDPPAVVHENVRDYPFESADDDRGHVDDADADRPNLVYKDSAHVGDVGAGFERADHVLEGEYETRPFQHCAMEPHVAVARARQDGAIRLRSSTQAPHVIEHELDRLYPDVDPAQLTIETPYVGGGFGGKVSAFLEAILLAVAREVSPRPVRLALSRSEEFTTGVSRPAARVSIRDGVTDDGDLLAREVGITFDTGAYNEWLFRVTVSVPPAIASMYDVPNVSWDCYEVYTNRPRTVAFRGFGKPQLYWAVERQMDRIADRLDLDPLAFRLRNLLRAGDRTALGERVGPNDAPACLRRAAARSRDCDPPAEFPDYAGAEWALGTGFAYGMKPVPRSVSTVTVRVQRDMEVEVRVGAPDIGQGAETMLTQLAAEAFGVDLSRVTVTAGDTDRTAYDRGPTGSRFTYHAGRALRKAALEAKGKLFELASERFDGRVAPEDLATAGGAVFVDGRPEESLPVNELFSAYGHPGTVSRTALSVGGELVGTATHDSGEGHACWTPVAQSAVVAVNTLTGELDVLRFHTACDVGYAINPKTVEQQLEGGAGQGIASAVYEEIVYDGGQAVNPNFKDYRVPGPTELPHESEVEIVESAPDGDVSDAKGVGETGMMAAAPAVGNAVADAVDVEPTTVPMTPERLLDLLETDA